MSVTAYFNQLRQLTVADLPQIAELQAAVTAGLTAGFIRSKSESELRANLDGTLGAAYGIVEAGALVAMSLLRIPSEKHPNPGLRFALESADVVVAAGLGETLVEEDWSLYTCFLEHAMVLPTARGRGYQRALLDARLAHAASAKMRWVCAGVHFQNSVSWANLLAKGMAIAGIRFDPGYPVLGLLRSLDARVFTSDSSNRAPVSAHDAFQHQAALQNGYIGVRLASDGAVIYQRLLLHGDRPRKRSPAHGRGRG